MPPLHTVTRAVPARGGDTETCVFKSPPHPDTPHTSPVQMFLGLAVAMGRPPPLWLVSAWDPRLSVPPFDL